MLEQTEEKEVIRLFRFVENQTFKSSRLSDLEIRKIKETQEKFTAEDRQKEEVLMLADSNFVILFLLGLTSLKQRNDLTPMTLDLKETIGNLINSTGVTAIFILQSPAES